VQVIGVGPNTPYQSAKELLDAMKAQPGKISVATAGVTSAGHNAIELIAKVAGIKYRHVTYDGGNPAVVATVAGETEVTTQLAVEEADMIRGKRLRPLATVSNKPLELDGYGTIPPLSDTLPGFSAPTNYFGIFIPKGVPDDVVATVQKIWTENIAKSEVLKKYALSRGALFAPIDGEAAQKAAFPAVQANAWLLFDSGKAKVSPDTVGIPRP
jgi:tripartite-type tricarboxylate transporter receptor subunit TctC